MPPKTKTKSSQSQTQTHSQAAVKRKNNKSASASASPAKSQTKRTKLDHPSASQSSSKSSNKPAKSKDAQALKTALQETANTCLKDDALSDDQGEALAVLLKRVSRQILSEIDQAEQRQGRPAASSSSTSNTADELDMLSTAELQSRLREVRALETDGSERLHHYRLARHQVERRERENYHRLHPLVRFLHPEMSKAIVDIDNQPRWLCRAVKERDGELHQDGGEQRQGGYDPSQDEWLSELLKSAQDARAAMRTSAGLEELNRYIEAGIETIDV